MGFCQYCATNNVIKTVTSDKGLAAYTGQSQNLTFSDKKTRKMMNDPPAFISYFRRHHVKIRRKANAITLLAILGGLWIFTFW